MLKIDIKNLKRKWMKRMIENKEGKKKSLKKDIINIIILIIIIILVATCYKCPTRYLFGIPCPGCGMTRALLALITLDVERAMYYHPLCIMVVIVGMIFAFDYLKVIKMSEKLKRGILFAGSIALIIVFIWRIQNGSPIVAVDFKNSILYQKTISRVL